MIFNVKFVKETGYIIKSEKNNLIHKEKFRNK